ncbi:hypothetical protein [Paenibacillus cremeus]|uniref:Uncharacterized protein n=1 Tax=Paenibacillus cremeus TaxID=2163881 RepID=A0A559K6I4_9BACL|nr:hypothetical protein [Paenibacillus cremeus]TVY07739.1 hypothetical protein FPZ49_22220 [Paenibacillus cremeus]
MLQLNGIVGGKNMIAVGAGKSKDLQIITITVAKGQKLILNRVNFLVSNDGFEFVVKALPSTGTFRARGGFGDLRPNKVLFNNTTGDAVILFLAVSVVNRTRRTLTLNRTDSWLLQITRK